MADQNEYDAVASQFLGARKQATTENVKLNISNALSVNPDEAAAVQKDANKLGVPIDSAMANPAEIRKQSYFESIGFNDVVDSKAASDFYQDQNKANIGHDSVSNMVDIAKTVKSLVDPLKSYGAGVVEGSSGMVNAMSEEGAKLLDQALPFGTGFKNDPFKLSGEFLEGLRKKSQSIADAIKGDQSNQGFIEKGINSGFESLGQATLPIAVGVITKNRNLGLALGGLTAGSQAISKALDAGKSPLLALKYGTEDFVAEVATELLPVHYLLKDLKAGSSLFKTIGHQLATEIPSEIVATVWQNMNEWLNLNPSKSALDFVKEQPDDIAQTIIATATMATMTGGFGHTINKALNGVAGKREDAKKSEATFEVLSKLNDLISTNKVKERDIESFHTFMQSATEDGDVSHVFIEPKVMVQALEASGMTQEQFATESPVISKQLNESMATNTDLAIPVADFATELAGKSYSQSLIAHLKTDPNGMSQVEAQQYMVEHGNDLKEEVEKILGENTNMQEFNASKDRVKQHILQNLNESTEWPAIKNENDAELIATRTAVRAAQLHMTPEALFNKHLLKVNADTASGDQVLQQAGKSAFGQQFKQFKGKAAEAIAHLKQAKSGEAVGALTHPELGPIDLIWGEEGTGESNGYGLAKLVKWHPEVVDDLQNIVSSMKVVNKGKNRVLLESDDHKGVVSLNWHGATRQWLLTSYEKRGATSTTIDTTGSKVEGDTARLNNASGDIVDRILSDFNKSSYNQSNPVFYSGLAKAVLAAKQATAPAKDWLPIINSLPGVKKEEIEWSGIKDYLAIQGKEKLTKEQVAQFINENGVQLNEKLLGDSRSEGERAQAAIAQYAESRGYTFDDRGPEGYSYLIDDETGDTIAEGEAQHIAMDLGLRLEKEGITKYGKWTLPGGENYKELLITLPEQGGVTYTNENVTAIEPQKALTPEEEVEYKTLMSKDIFEMTDAEVKRMGDLGSIYTKIASDPDRFWYFNAPEQVFQIPKSKYKTEAEAKAYILREKQLEADPKSNYKSSHWDDLNVLAHIRFNDRTDSEGNKVLFVEEIQSDWHQAGRKKGYRGDMSIDQARQKMLDNGYSPESVANSSDEDIVKMMTQYGVPNAPLKDTKAWAALAVKRITRYAAEHGYDKVAFVNGAQAADRFDLSAEIDDLTIARNKTNFVISATNKEGLVAMHKSIPDLRNLDEIIGKDLAEKIKDDFANKSGNEHSYSGLDLKVGGEGMEGFYDKILPQVVNDVLKKVGGGKIEPMEIGTEKKVTYDQIQEAEKRRDFDEAERLTHIMERQELGHGDESIRGEMESLTQPGFSLTPDIRSAVMSGQTLFQAQRGQIAFGSDLAKSPSIITLLKSADLSTFLHESGHFFFESDIHLAAELNRTANETDISMMSDGEQQIMSDVSKMLEWHGLQGNLNEQLNQWYTLSDEERRSYHERTAESFERYLFEGKAPSVELQRLFQTFQAWLLQAYKSIKKFVEANPEAGNLNPEIRQVFDRMLATSEQIQLAEQSRSMMPLFESVDQSGMTTEGLAAYHKEDLAATLEARDILQTRSLKDMQWLQNARSKIIKKLQQEHKVLRAEVMMDARRQVLSQPIYQAYTFLTNRMTKEDKITPDPLPKSDKNKVIPAIDSMFTAIAKLGGLKRDQIDALMGLDSKMKSPMPVFGKYVFKREGGIPLDSMGELLADYGYLPVDEHGKFDTRDLEEKLDSELRGDPQYSIEVDDRILRGADKAGLGVDIAGLGAGRLSKGELVGEFTAEQIAVLEAKKMVSSTGIAPDFIAEQFGITSADEMVRSLVSIPSPKEAINTLTDQMMIERYGDLNSPEALSKAADEAVHNKLRTKVITTDLNVLNKLMGKPQVLASAAKDFAEAMINRLIIRNLRPGQYSASEVRAAKAAEKAFKEGNREVAAAEKRNQLVNNYATKAVYNAQKEVEQIRKFFSQVLGGKDEDIAKYRDMDMVNAARAILAPLGYGGKATTAIDYLTRVKTYDPALHEVLSASVNAAQLVAKPINDLTLDQLRDIKEEVEALWHLSRRGKQMELDGDLIDRQEAADALISRMQEIGLPENMPGEMSAITEQEVRHSRVQQFKAFLRRVESWVDLKDGSNKMGAFRKYIFSPIKGAADAYRQEKLVRITAFRDSFESIAKTMEKGQIHSGELNYTFGKDSGGVAMNEIMHAILHRGNDSNFRKLLLGRKWADLLEDGTMDTTRWDAFEKRMQQEGKLTKAHYDFAQNVWDQLDDMKPGAQKAHRDAYGRYFTEVTANEFHTPFGMYRGGYVPAKVDSRIVKDMELKKLIEEGKDGMMFAFPSTNKGFTKGRVEYNRPLMLDMRTIAQHIDQVLLFTHMENPSRDVSKLLGMGEVGSLLNQQDPEAINSMLTPWLTRSAKQLVTTPVAGSAGLMRFFSVLRSRTSMSAMFANISNTAQQITGFSLAALKVRSGSMLSSTAQYMKNPKQMTEDVAGLSMFMAHRMDNQVTAMIGDVEQILLNPSLFAKSQEWTKKHTFFMQSAVDNVMGTIIWNAAYNEAVEDGHNSEDRKSVV